MRDFVIEVEAAEPPVSQMQIDFLRQPTFRPQTVAVPDNQHPDHQLRINRWPTDLAIIGLQPRVHPAERRRHEYINTPEQVVLRYSIIEPERIEQAFLIPIQPPHHRRLQAGDPRNQRNHCSATLSSLFRQHRSLADIPRCPGHVRYYPESRHCPRVYEYTP